MREVFYSFDYDEDVWRVQQIRQMGLFQGNEPALKNKWEEVKRKGDTAIKQWINDNMKNKTCLIVLIGEKTANSKWVQYEIQCAWEKGMGMLGIAIHNMRDQDGKKASKGRNPLVTLFSDWNFLGIVSVLHPAPLRLPRYGVE